MVKNKLSNKKGMAKMKLKYLSLLIPILFFVGCGLPKSNDEVIVSFNSKFNAGEYRAAGDIYIENKSDKDFLENVNLVISSDLVSKEKYLNSENYLEVQDDVILIDVFYDGANIDKLNKKIDDLILEKVENEKKESDAAKAKLEAEISKLEEEKKALKNESDRNNNNNTKTPSVNNGAEVSKYSNFSYQYYKNSRYGFSISYPSFLTETDYPANGDGVMLQTFDGSVSLVVSGGNNIMNYNIKDLYNEAIKTTPNVVYKSLANNSYVISWAEGGYNFYSKTALGTGSINTFTLKSPSGDAKVFDGVTTTIYNSFKTGDLSRGW